MVLLDTRKGHLEWKKWFITGWAFMECFLFSGYLYGWGSISYVLKMEGIYADLCDYEQISNNMLIKTSSNTTFSTMSGLISTHTPTTDLEIIDGSVKICKSQEAKMALCFTIATAVMGIGGASMAFMNYKFGTRVTRLISFSMFVSGAVMIAFVSKEHPWLIFPGFTFISTAGLPVMITNMQVAYLFTAKGSIVVGILNGGYDSSSVVMLLMKIAYENGFDRQNMFILIAALHSSVLVSTFLFLPKSFIVAKTSNNDRSVTVNEFENRGTEEKIPSLKNCLLNAKFLTNLIWFTVLNIRFQYFSGTLNQYLTRMLDTTDDVSYFTNVCYYIMLGGLVTSFLSGAVFDLAKSKCEDGKSPLYRNLMPAVPSLALTSMFAVLMSVMVLIPLTEVLYPIFIVMTIYRAFLYSSNAAFLRQTFPSEYFAFLFGTLALTSAIFSTTQYGLFAWIESYEKGPLHADTFLLCVTLLSLVHPFYWWIKCRRNEKQFTETLCLKPENNTYTNYMAEK